MHINASQFGGGQISSSATFISTGNGEMFNFTIHMDAGTTFDMSGFIADKLIIKSLVPPAMIRSLVRPMRLRRITLSTKTFSKAGTAMMFLMSEATRT